MHLLFDSTFPARNRSGIGVYGRELLAALRTEAPHWRIQDFTAPGFQHKPDLPRKVADAAGFILGVEGLLPLRAWQSRPDIYHAPAFIAPLLPLPCALVLTIHDTILEDGWQAFHPAWKLFHRLSLRVAIARAHGIIVPSRHTAADLQRVYGAHTAVHVVPYGVNPQFRPLPETTIAPVLERCGIRRPYVLHVAAQVERKNQVRLVEAFARLRREADFADITLVLAGPPGNATAALQRALAEWLPATAVRFLGTVPQADLHALFAGARLFAFPSLYEGSGMPPLEAMACGVPVVTSNRGAVCEAVGGIGILVDPFDVAAIAAGLRRGLADETLAAELAARGLAHSRQFTWRRAARQTMAVYEAALAERSNSNTVPKR